MQEMISWIPLFLDSLSSFPCKLNLPDTRHGSRRNGGG